MASVRKGPPPAKSAPGAVSHAKIASNIWLEVDGDLIVALFPVRARARSALHESPAARQPGNVELSDSEISEPLRERSVPAADHEIDFASGHPRAARMASSTINRSPMRSSLSSSTRMAPIARPAGTTRAARRPVRTTRQKSLTGFVDLQVGKHLRLTRRYVGLLIVNPNSATGSGKTRTPRQVPSGVELSFGRLDHPPRHP
jgi:hypothetical protein